MRALVYHGKKDIRIDRVETPRCKTGWALIEVKWAGICGSDLTIYHGKHSRAKPPVILGHEFSGVIVERKGSHRTDLAVGDRVTVEPTFFCGTCDLCRSGYYHICKHKGLYGIDADGGFADVVCIPLQMIFKLPDDVTFEEGAMVEPLAVSTRAVARSCLMVGESATILGAGPIGILTAQVARAAGAGAVFIVEPVAFRREMAENMGFAALDANDADVGRILEATEGRGTDVVFDAAGTAPAALLWTRLVKRTGRVVLLSIYKDPAPVDLAAVTYGEIDLKGTCIYTFEDFSKALSFVDQRQVDLLPLVTHRFSLDRGIEAFRTFIEGEGVQKVLLTAS